MGGAASPGARGGWRVPAPAPDQMIDWPTGFGTRCTIFVDTEEEFDWTRPFSRSARAVSATAALPTAHRRFADHGAPLTFMVDHPIVSDDRSVSLLAQITADGRSSIGAQLHPWVNPPFGEEQSIFNSFAGNLDSGSEAAKIDVLTMAIARAFGRAPRAFRAGRYGIGPATAALLAERGYRLDTSMRARHDYSAQGGPDFAAIDNGAFRFGPAGSLIELPLTTIFTGRWRARGADMYRRARAIPRATGLLARTGLLGRVPFTPEQVPIADALEAVRLAVGDGLRLLNFSFHSPSLVPGHTPYVRDAADLAAFWRWWDAVFALLRALGVSPISSDDLIAAAAAPAA